MESQTGSVTPDSRLKLYKATLCLAYQSLGVVYGDLSMSPIYVYTTTFSGRMRLHEEEDEIFGVLSLVFWTLTAIPLLKYVILVLGADDNGEGGTVALYSLLCRKSKVSLLSHPYAPDDDISAYSDGIPKETRASSFLKEFFQKYQSSRIILLLVVLLGTSMTMGDGVLTPSMSVLSAVYGIKIKATGLHENYSLFIACAILVGLFTLQHFGTHKVGFLFAPIMIAWLFCISGIGIYNIIRWNPHIVGALSPYYIYNYFKKAGKDGWSSLGGIVLCITGAEAMFADLGHFSHLSIRIVFTVFVYPCLVLAYMGEAAYLSKHKEDLQRSFFRAIPEAVFWPVFVIATLATVVGSQALISATFSIISQCRALKCFPRVKVIHTSDQIHGQIYIPEVNWILMVLCLFVVIGFKDTDKIGNAYGLAVITVMFITSVLMSFVIIMVWKHNVFVAVAFLIVFGSLELLYYSSCLAKVHEGGWLPLVFSFAVLSMMCVWHYGTLMKHYFESQNKVQLDTLVSLGPNLGINRVPGIGLIYSGLTSGIPPMFSHFVTNFPVFHQILIFVTLQTLTVPKIPANQKFLFSRIGPPGFLLFRCIVRYGYKDARKSPYDFEINITKALAEFLQCSNPDRNDGRSSVGEEIALAGKPSGVVNAVPSPLKNGAVAGPSGRKVSFFVEGNIRELKKLEEAREMGLAYMMGNTRVLASERSSYVKKFVIDVLYGFLRGNCRQPATALEVPHASLIEIGMVYRV